ncbi:hypothetical protein RUM44_008534 [Polyplax serrata]|uniref:Uncharacterized protein n=1 Tax=Polyplax serrata TaxID=468196 RepID=A0ABR1BAG2_POLSC
MNCVGRRAEEDFRMPSNITGELDAGTMYLLHGSPNAQFNAFFEDFVTEKRSTKQTEKRERERNRRKKNVGEKMSDKRKENGFNSEGGRFLTSDSVDWSLISYRI